VQIQQTAPKQTVMFDEEGLELTLEALAMNATGKVALNLKALEANAQASGEAANLMNVKTVDGSEKLEIDSAFDVKMTVTYEVAETIKAAKEGLKSAKETREVAEDVAEDVTEKLEAPQE
jgi:flagellar motor switch/type III secretory pathway protein FliN